jgi:hypothetical protein
MVVKGKDRREIKVKKEKMIVKGTERKERKRKKRRKRFLKLKGKEKAVQA